MNPAPVCGVLADLTVAVLVKFLFSVSAFLGPLCSYAFPVSGANASDVSALANHTTAQQGQEQGTSVNITTANVAVAHEAGAELLEQAMATSLTTRQKQELVLKLSSAKYLAMDLMAAYVSLGPVSI